MLEKTVGKFIDLSGQTFGKLTVCNEVPPLNKKRRWLCKCECGATIEVAQSNLKRQKSCGCARGKHGLSGSRAYTAWENMKQRCLNPNNKDFKKYGGAGVGIDERWLDFEQFWQDMRHKYANHLELDRIDNSKGYEPSNCRWATESGQTRNRVATKLDEIDAGAAKSLMRDGFSYYVVSKMLGVAPNTILAIKQTITWREVNPLW